MDRGWKNSEALDRKSLDCFVILHECSLDSVLRSWLNNAQFSSWAVC